MNKNLSTERADVMKSAMREGRVPFETKSDPFYSAPNMEALKRSASQLCQGKTVVKTIDELLAFEDE